MMDNRNHGEVKSDDGLINLPPGFRFHPTDEELITQYLSKKVVDSRFSCIAIGEVDMNKVEPWELPWRAKLGEKEWYFFCIRDKKYPTGQRTNRATAEGYWKATGKDKEIFRGKSLVGMKKTLVFYKGRAPKGEKSNWVSHEYRLEGNFSILNLPKSSKSDWVISRVFQKAIGGKKVHISGLMNNNQLFDNSSTLPPLMDPAVRPGGGEPPGLVHCFSAAVGGEAAHENFMADILNNPIFPSSCSSNPMDSFQTFPSWAQYQYPVQPGLQYPGSGSDPRTRFANYSEESPMGTENKVSGEDEEDADAIGPQDLDSMWRY
ncbi:hypothetical protein ABFX02_09G040800 [Erythranthe guttata]